MRKLFLLTVLTASAISCTRETKELSPEEKRRRDSLSKVEQRMHVDSMKRQNPLLIAPPDSEYTGEYVDKYPSGIVKFKGLFRFGKRHGVWLSFYPDGLMWSELHYDKGLRHGPNVAYFTNGKKRYEGFYKNDMQDSVWIYYDTSGAVSQKYLYKNNRAVKDLLAEEKAKGSK